jgi:hypothetical protein
MNVNQKKEKEKKKKKKQIPFPPKNLGFGKDAVHCTPFCTAATTEAKATAPSVSRPSR